MPDNTAAELVAAATAGFESLPVGADVRAAAVTNLESWLSDPAFRAYGHQIRALVAAGCWDELLDAFYRLLPFGTGGRRGAVGVGPNRFNPWTLGASVQGHAAWLRRVHGEGPLRVVIGCDVRRFQDLRGRCIADVPNPVLGLTSQDFARIAAEVYAAAGITAVLPPPDTFLSTPELSFAVRRLQAAAGLNISASHNHPDDNGGKFYDHRGGQTIPPDDEAMANEVARVAFVDRMPLDRAQASGLVEFLPKTVPAEYRKTILRSAPFRRPDGLRIVFTALHGTGLQTVFPSLQEAGYDVHLEPSQGQPDGAFPEVPFRAPNPEVPRCMDAATHFAATIDADLIFSCDPDADRLGVMVRRFNPDPMATDPMRWVFLNGNEIAALVTHAVLQDHPAPDRAIVFKTEVTSAFVTRIAAARGARVVGHLLVGFKYIGAALGDLEDHGMTYGVSGSIDDFAVGVEESHGVLLTHELRDKDAAGGALALAALAAAEKRQSRTLLDVLSDLRSKVGEVSNVLLSSVMRGAVGRARIEQIQQDLRASPPAAVGGRAVVDIHDRQDENGPFGPIRSETDRSSRDVLVFELEGNARVVLRPSGTEPKNKVYVEVCGRPGDRKNALDRAARDIGEQFVLDMLSRVGISLPAWALRASDLVSVEHKALFAAEILPSLVAQLARDDADAAELKVWLDTQLRDFGPDPVELMAPAVWAWLDATRPPLGEAVRELFRPRVR